MMIIYEYYLGGCPTYVQPIAAYMDSSLSIYYLVVTKRGIRLSCGSNAVVDILMFSIVDIPINMDQQLIGVDFYVWLGIEC